MKGTKPKTTTAPSSKAPTKTATGAAATTTPSSSGQRNPGTASKELAYNAEFLQTRILRMLSSRNSSYA